MKKMSIGCFLFVLSIFLLSGVNAQEQNDSTKVSSVSASSKEEKNRNVMLNAESANSPRDVNIGLPFQGDIVILENDVPVVYYFYPTFPTSAWRVDNSLSRIGLLSFEEGALLYGKVGFAVSSYDRDFSRKFKGFASSSINSMGSSSFDVTLTGPLKNGWGYMASFYQFNDRANGANYQYSSWSSRTSMAKLSIQKKYKKGSVKLLYKYVDDNRPAVSSYNPLLYMGDGETKALDNFSLGKDSYLPGSGIIPTVDRYQNTVMADLNSDEFSRTESHNIYLVGDHEFDNGWKLNYSGIYQKMNSPLSIVFPLSLSILDVAEQNANGRHFYKLGTTNEYTGKYVQSMYSQMSPQSDCEMYTVRAEMTKKIKNHDLRFGTTVQMFHRAYDVLTGSWRMTVEANPTIVTTTAGSDDPMYNPYAYGSYADDKWEKQALYVSDDFKLGSRLDLSVGARIEHQDYTTYHDPYKNFEGLEDKELLKYKAKNQWNKVAYGKFVYKLTNHFGLLGDVCYNVDNKTTWDYPYRDENGASIDENGYTAGFHITSTGLVVGHPRATKPKNYEISVLKSSGGIYLNIGKKLNLVSKLTYIEKNNILGSATLDDPTSMMGVRADFGPEFYNIQTMGWSTDIMSEPFKNFSIHYLLTLQKPEYKDYSVSGFGQTYDYSDNIIPSLSQVLMEIDPSYTFGKGKYKAWVSLRYFGKQYANETNAFTYNPWWENFGGFDYYVSRNLTFKLQVVNFLDQAGVKGKIEGAAQIQKEDIGDYIGKPIVASAIRPRTIELKVNYKF